MLNGRGKTVVRTLKAAKCSWLRGAVAFALSLALVFSEAAGLSTFAPLKAWAADMANVFDINTGGWYTGGGVSYGEYDSGILTVKGGVPIDIVSSGTGADQNAHSIVVADDKTATITLRGTGSQAAAIYYQSHQPADRLYFNGLKVGKGATLNLYVDGKVALYSGIDNQGTLNIYPIYSVRPQDYDYTTYLNVYSKHVANRSGAETGPGVLNNGNLNISNIDLNIYGTVGIKNSRGSSDPSILNPKMTVRSITESPCLRVYGRTSHGISVDEYSSLDLGEGHVQVESGSSSAPAHNSAGIGGDDAVNVTISGDVQVRAYGNNSVGIGSVGGHSIINIDSGDASVFAGATGEASVGIGSVNGSCDITIESGIVSTTGTNMNNSVGIGSINGKAGIKINGGLVSALGPLGWMSATRNFTGIGGTLVNSEANMPDIKIYDAHVSAGAGGTGVGVGASGTYGAKIDIRGSIVTARSGSNAKPANADLDIYYRTGTGIGDRASKSQISIASSVVTADDVVGIGGKSAYNSPASSLKITNSLIFASTIDTPSAITDSGSVIVLGNEEITGESSDTTWRTDNYIVPKPLKSSVTTVSIDAGFTLTVPAGNQFKIPKLLVQIGGAVVNDGTVTIGNGAGGGSTSLNGSVINRGVLSGLADSTVTNSGTITVDSGYCQFHGAGLEPGFSNEADGKILINDTAVFGIECTAVNEGDITVNRGGELYIVNSGQLLNRKANGITMSDGAIVQAYGTLTGELINGSNVSTPTEKSGDKTDTSITINAVSLLSSPTPEQTVKYAKSTTSGITNPGALSWQDDTTFSGLTPETTYYIYAQAQQNDYFNAGTMKQSAAIVATNATTPKVDAKKPSITTHPQGDSYKQGQTPTPLSVTATRDDNGTLSYQWFSNTTNSNTGGTKLNGETNTTYTPSTATVGTVYYYVEVTNTIPSGENVGVSTAMEKSSVAAITINALAKPVITTPSGALTPGTVGVPSYSVTLTATNTPTSWSISSGTLPDSLTPGGTTTYVISGKPTKAGTFPFSVIATNADGDSDLVQFSITIAKGTQSAPTGLAPVSPTVFGGSDGKITGLTAGNLYEVSSDNGTTWNTATLVGTEITGLSAGTYKIRLAENDDYYASPASAAVTISNPAARNAKPPVITGQPQGGTYKLDKPATALSVTARNDDADGTLTYQWYKNTSNGTTGATAIDGEVNDTYTPGTSVVGTAYYYVVVTNTIPPNGDGGTKTAPTRSNIVPVNVTALTPPVVNARTFADGTYGKLYPNVTLTASNAPTGWSISGGELPAGLALSPTSGVISGTPTAAGTFPFSVVATNDDGDSLPKDFVITISQAAQAAPMGLTKTDETGEGANDGTISGLTAAAMEYKLIGGAYSDVPGATLSGLAPGSYLVRYAETANLLRSGDTPVVIGAFGAALSLAPNAAYDISASTVNAAIQAVDLSCGVSGGVAPYTFSATGFPPGIAVSSGGIISGTPAAGCAAGTATVTVTDNAMNTTSIVVNFAAVSDPLTYSLIVNPTRHTFTSAYPGYSNTTMKQVFTVTNTGTGAITGLTAGLAGADSAFEICEALSAATIAPGGSVTVAVRPSAGLSPYPYADALTISGDKGNELVVALEFTVDTALTYTAEIDPASVVYTAARVGYSNTAMAQTFTIRNTGTAQIKGLKASFVGANFVKTSELSATAVNAGGTATISVAPKNGLAASATPYTGQLIIRWDNDDGGLSVDLSFTVSNAQTYRLTINAGAGGTVTVGADGDYAQGAAVSITAAANAGFKFNGWTSSNGGTFGNAGNASTTFTMPGTDVTVSANFTYVGGPGPVIYGDLTGTGDVGVSDLILMLRYFARPGIAINTAAADVNGDGVVNNADLVLFCKYFAQPGVVLGPKGA